MTWRDSIQRLWVRLLATHLILGLIPALLIALLGIYTAWDVLHQAVRNGHREIAKRATREILYILDQPGRSLQVLSQAMSVDRDPWLRQSLLSQVALKLEGARELCLVDTSGRIQATSVLDANAPLGRGQRLPDNYRSDAGPLGRAVLQGDTYTSEMILQDGQPSLRLALPVWEGEAVVGALIARFGLHEIWERIDQIKLGTTGRCVLLDKNGRYIASPMRQQVFQNAVHPQIDSMRGSQVGVLEWTDGQEIEWMAAFVLIEDWGWTVVVEQQTGEAFGLVSLMRQRINRIIAFSALMAVFLGLIILRSITGPVNQLMRAVRAMQAGKPPLLNLPSRRDEIWELGKAFEEMSETLEDRQQALEASLAFQERLFEDNPMGIAVLDADYAIVQHNKAWNALFDGNGQKSLHDTAEGSQLAAWLEQHPTEKMAENLPFKGHNGITRSWNLRVVDLHSAYPEEKLLVVEDKTQQRSLELHYMQAEKLSSLGEMAAGVAHEIKNPLAIMQSACDLLVRLEPEEEEEKERILATLRGAIRRTNERVGNLLDFARPAREEKEFIDMASIVQQLLDLERKYAAHRKIDIKENLRSVPLVYINRDVLKDILLNLTRNAFGAMPEGGELGVEIESQEGWVIVQIRDTGTGIAPEHINRVFEPFFSTKPPGQGTGLGLSIAQSQIKGAGGRIEVESPVGQGTCFSIYLPIKLQGEGIRE